MGQTIDATRLAEALQLAISAHGDQTRKGSGAPYVSHLLVVCGLVIEHGGDTDQAIAALLHDAIEDCSDVTRESIKDAFGDRVARMVNDCTDTLPGDTPEEKSAWELRKRRYLEHLQTVEDDSLLVAACDKYHNLNSLIGELRTQGLGILKNFKAGSRQQIWFFEEILQRVTGRVPMRLQLELEDLIGHLRTSIQSGDTQGYKMGEFDLGGEKLS